MTNTHRLCTFFLCTNCLHESRIGFGDEIRCSCCGSHNGTFASEPAPLPGQLIPLQTREAVKRY